MEGRKIFSDGVWLKEMVTHERAVLTTRLLGNDRVCTVYKIEEHDIRVDAL